MASKGGTTLYHKAVWQDESLECAKHASDAPMRPNTAIHPAIRSELAIFTWFYR
jgi:hypothetical protein